MSAILIMIISRFSSAKTELYQISDSICCLTERLLQENELETEDFSTLMELFMITVSAARNTLSFLQSFTSAEQDIESSDSFASIRGLKSDSFDQLCFAETPKNVSKRKKYKNLGFSSFEDSLKDAEPSEIDDIFNVPDNNNEGLINKNECCEESSVQTQAEAKNEQLSSVNISEKEVKDEAVPDDDNNSNELMSYADICRRNVDAQDTHVVVIQESQNWRYQDSEAEFCDNSFETFNDTNTEQPSIGRIDDTKHLKDDGTEVADPHVETEIPSTPCIPSRLCDQFPADPKLLRKLSILDEQKFITEPISPIVSIDASNEGDISDERLNISKHDVNTQDLVSAVNSTFNSSPAATNVKCIDKTDSVIKTPFILGKTTRNESRNISFCDEVDVFYFERCQGWGSVPKEGGNTLGMVNTHFHFAKESICDAEDYEPPLAATPEPVKEVKTRKSKRLSMNQSMPCLSSVSSVPSSSVGSEDKSLSELSSSEWISTIQKPGVIKLTKVASLSQINENVEVENITDLSQKSQKRERKTMSRNAGRSFLVSQINDSVLESSDTSLTLNSSKSGKRGELGTRGLERIKSRKRKTLLKSCSVLDLDPGEAEECRKLRDSRREVGCGCYGGKCQPDTCFCAASGITCHEVHVLYCMYPVLLYKYFLFQEQEGSPCCCSESNCKNPNGRYRFDRTSVNLHLVETLMTVQSML